MGNPTLSSRLRSVPAVVWLMLLTSVCLVPFANKAVHIDDTLFLRAAQQIQREPANFYGFRMNWFGHSSPMVDNFDNPPLACYYLALVGAVAGWSEPALHLGFLLPALAAAWGTYSLARRLCSRPLLASVVAVLTPAFIISATTLMCDVLLVALWTWSVVWFERGLRNGRRSAFAISGILAGMAYWTKFPGLALVPLLGFWGFARQRRAGWWLVSLVLPVLFAGAYEWVTFKLYGQGLLLTAAGVAAKTPHRGRPWEMQLLGLSFLGGCLFPLLFYLPRRWLWSFRNVAMLLGFLGLCLLVFPYSGHFGVLWGADKHPEWPLVLQSLLFIIAGFVLLLLTAADFLEHRDPQSLLLVLWVFGVFVFATALNWTVNGRTLLPLVPAVGILVARRLDSSGRAEAVAAQPDAPLTGTTDVAWAGDRAARQGRSFPWRQLWPALGGAALSLLLAKADYDLAGAGRSAAAALAARYQPAGKTLWFEGHWGFQYYMEQHQAQALEWPFLTAGPGDFVVIPSEASNTFDISKDLVRLVDIFEYKPNARWTTMSVSAGAGFYASVFGPFPYSLGRIEPQRFFVLQVKQSLEAALKGPGGVSPAGVLTAQSSP